MEAIARTLFSIANSVIGSKMMDASIDIATENDLESLLPLVRAYHEFEGFELTDSQRQESVRKLLANRSLGAIWKIYASNRLVGYIALCVGYSIEFQGIDAFVDEFYIDPEFRGKGIGTQSLNLIRQQAKEMGIRALYLEVARTNTKARNFYSKMDFQAREKYLLMSVNL